MRAGSGGPAAIFPADVFRSQNTLLSPLCQSERAGAVFIMVPLVTSSLWTGRALEKARFFYDVHMTDPGRIPLTGLKIRRSVRTHEVGQSDREQ